MADQANSSGERLAVEGTFQVSILDEPQWELVQEKDGDADRMALIVRGYVNGGEQDAKWIDTKMMFIRTIIGGGRDAGKTMFEAQADKCLEMGMSDPFSPSKVAEMVGGTCEFVCEHEEWTDKHGNTHNPLRVKFINTGGTKKIPMDEAQRIWAALAEDEGLSSAMPESAMSGSALGEADPLDGSIDPDDNVPF